MKIEIHHYLHWAADDRVIALLTQVLTRVDAIASGERQISMNIADLKAKLQAEADALTAAVSRATTIEQSVETLLNGQAAQLAALRQQLADAAKAADIPAETFLAAIDATIAASQAVSDKLAAAVVANTAVA
jgi:predicted transcriptional regulator